jgi:hypothetical protein
MEPLSPKKTSLSQLPTEIKLLVIKYLALQTKKDRRGGGVDEIAAPWLNLAFVNRSFYELCSAINWKVRLIPLFFQYFPLAFFPVGSINFATRWCPDK